MFGKKEGKNDSGNDIKENLKKLTARINAEKELADEFERDGLENKANRMRCYHSRINQYGLLIERTQLELDNLLSKDIQFGRWSYYKKSTANLRERKEGYSRLLEEYTEKKDKEHFFENPVVKV